MSSIMLAMLFVLGSLVLWGITVVVERFESKSGRIPKHTQDFLYFQDWAMATWGDLIGLSIIDGIAGYFFSTTYNPTLTLLALGMGAAGSVAFHLSCLSWRHRPDAGYPGAGRISLHGRAHLLYLFMQSFVCAYVFLLAVEGTLWGWPLTAALFGAAIFLASFMEDWRHGRLDPLPQK